MQKTSKKQNIFSRSKIKKTETSHGERGTEKMKSYRKREF